MSYPLSDFAWIKPTVLLYQPIMTPSQDRCWQGGFLGDANLLDSFLLRHRLNNRTGEGILFRQWADRVQSIFDLQEMIELDDVIGESCKTMSEIVAQAYDFQLHLYEQFTYRTSVRGADRNSDVAFHESFEQMKRETTRGLADFYRGLLESR